MNDAVFISDLHLNPEKPDITERLKRFIQWASTNTRSVYILGDFFHAWAGDDSRETWSESIAQQLSWLASQGVSLFYMHGNRDFLLSNAYAKRASLQLLPDPTVITLDGTRVLLSHGDQYCTNDWSHQCLRRLTRNVWFPELFLRIPYQIRRKCVEIVRQWSQNHTPSKSLASMDIVPEVMMKQMAQYSTSIVIHGHIHRPGLTERCWSAQPYIQYVLSDWDDNPQVLCYNKPHRFCFIPLVGETYGR